VGYRTKYLFDQAFFTELCFISQPHFNVCCPSGATATDLGCSVLVGLVSAVEASAAVVAISPVVAGAKAVEFVGRVAIGVAGIAGVTGTTVGATGTTVGATGTIVGVTMGILDVGSICAVIEGVAYFVVVVTALIDGVEENTGSGGVVFMFTGDVEALGLVGITGVEVDLGVASCL
jgi:hypothetical protein